MTLGFPPRNKGRLISSVQSLDFVWSEFLESGQTYALQVVENRRPSRETKAKIILLQIDFDPISAASAIASSEAITLSWNSVSGANSYEVYADSAMTLRLGTTSINRLTIQPNGRSLKEFYVRALRGGLASKDVIRIELQQSSVELTKVSSPLTNGLYGPGEVLDFDVSFTEPVTVYGESALPLNFFQSNRLATYKSGSGTNVLRFRYTVQTGDDTEHLETGDVLTGEYLDQSDLAVTRALPLSSDPNSLKKQRQLRVDTKAPTAPGSVGFASSTSLDGDASASWTASTDLNFLEHRVKLCGAFDCSSSCSAESSTTGSQQTFESLNDGSYYLCVKGVDAVGLSSTWTSSVNPIRVDSTPPTVLRVFASSDGYFRTGQTVSLNIEFSEVVVVSGAGLNLALDVGGAARSATYVSGSGSTSLLFTYTVQTARLRLSRQACLRRMLTRESPLPTSMSMLILVMWMPKVMP